MSKWGIAGAWVLVAALVTALTWQIVSAADAQVSDRPPLQVEPTSSAAGSTTSALGSPSSSAATSSSSSTTPDSAPSSTSATTPGSAGTAPPATGAAWSSRTIQTDGGVVVVSYRPNEVVLSSAAPAAGFSAEIKKQGPPEVDVEFESEAAKYRVRASWANGDLAVEAQSEAESEDA